MPLLPPSGHRRKKKTKSKNVILSGGKSLQTYMKRKNKFSERRLWVAEPPAATGCDASEEVGGLQVLRAAGESQTFRSTLGAAEPAAHASRGRPPPRRSGTQASSLSSSAPLLFISMSSLSLSSSSFSDVLSLVSVISRPLSSPTATEFACRPHLVPEL